MEIPVKPDLAPLDDPFAPPVAPLGVASDARPDDFFALFLRWEEYRLFYNGVLVAETLLGFWLANPRRTTPSQFLIVGIYALGANVCFCAGLALNGYAWWLGWRSPWVGRAILGAGTVLAMLLAAGALIGLLVPNSFLMD